MIKKNINGNNIYIVNSNFDYINENNLIKDNINSIDFLKGIEKDSIVVLQDYNLGGYMTFLETIKSYNKSNPDKTINPVISLKIKQVEGEDVVYYAKDKQDIEKLLSINNPFFDNINHEELGLMSNLDETNYLIFKVNNIYDNLLDISTGYFSPKYSGKFEPLLNPENNFEEVKNYLINKVEEKLKININDHPEYITRINEEISVLSGGNHMKQNFLEYMFVVSDMVTIAKENDIRVGPGRGSGAGSLTAYLLDITEVNPITNELSFERFLNKDRPSFPDFDLDFDSSKLNILKKLISDKLGYSIIQIGTLNSHSHNDFLPNIRNLSFLTEDEKNKIIYDIKNDFDIPEKKEKILKNGEEYLYEKLLKFGYDVKKYSVEINNNINKKFNNVSFFNSNDDVSISALKELKSSEYKKILKELYSDAKNKNILNKIGFNNLDYDSDKTALMRAVEIKDKLVNLLKANDVSKEDLIKFESDFQEKLFGGRISGRFFDFLVVEKRTNDELLDFNLEKLHHYSFLSSMKDLGDFEDYSKYISERIGKFNIHKLHQEFTNNLNENNKEFYNLLYNFIIRQAKDKNNINKKDVLDVLKYIDDIKVSEMRNLSKNYTILNELTNENGLINAFIKNFETYKGLGAHASGHIIVNKQQFNDMLKVFPILQQKEEKGKKKAREPVMGVSHKYVEKFGGVKFDLLGLKTLTIYEIAKKMSNSEIKESYWERGNIVCEKIIDFLSEDRDFSFIFQAEGVEIKTALNIVGKQLKENKDMKLIDSISNVIALCRPGPIENGTLYDYLSEGKKTIENFDDKNISGDGILKIRDKISKSLEGTNGYLIYQEQVIDIAKVMGLSGGEADNFRRAISKKNVELLAEQQQIFVEKGLSLCGGDEFKTEGNKLYLESVFKNLASFAEYGFNKSHSVCYANLCCEGAYYAVEKPKEFVTALFNTYGGEVGSLDGQADFKEVLKSNDKIESLMGFAGSLNVNISPYWEAYNINFVDVNKETDKEHKKLTHLNNNSVVLSSKILNSRNIDKIDYKTCWAKGKAIGSGAVVDISNLRFSNQRNYLLKNGGNDFNVKALATFLRIGNNGRLEFTAANDNNKKYVMFSKQNMQQSFNELKNGDSVILDIKISENKQISKVFANVEGVKFIDKNYYHNMYNSNIEINNIKQQKPSKLNQKAIDQVIMNDF